MRNTIGRWGLCCFSAVRDNILMWSHYANKHQGFCLVFSNELAVVPKGIGRCIVPFPMTYSGPIPVIDPTAFANQAAIYDLVRKIILTKAHEWEYEKEWRIVLPNITRWQPFSSHYLTGIIFGCRMSEAHKEMIRGWCKDRHPPIKYYQAQQSKKEYRLHIEEIP